MPPVEAGAVRRLPASALIVVAAALWWCVGCLPWVASGLSQATTTGGVMGSASEGLADVRLAVPLIAHQLPLLVVLTTIGGALAGAVTALGRGRASANAACAGLGAGLAVSVALVQSRSAIEENAAGNFAADSRVLAGLCLAAVAGTTFGLVCGLLAVRGPRGMRAMTLALLAMLLPMWTKALLARDLGPFQPAYIEQGIQLTPWLGGFALGLALAAGGLRPVHRLVWWLPAVGVAWVVGPALTALTYLAVSLRPSGGLPGSLPDLIDGARAVLVEALAPEHHPPGPWFLAIGVAVALVAIPWRRWQRGAPAAD